MEKIFTIETRLELNEEIKSYLNEYVSFYNMVSRNMWHVMKQSDFSIKYNKSEFMTHFCNKYNLLRRTVNSIYYDLDGKKKSLIELKKYELKTKINKYEALIASKEKVKNVINKLKLNVTNNKATLKELIKYRNNKYKYYHLCNKINKLKQNIKNLEKSIDEGNLSLGFGGKKHFKSQYNLVSTNYKTHKKWKNNYIKLRDKNIFYLGTSSESNGNQLAQLTYNKETDTFTLQLRKEKNYVNNNKYLIINNIDIKYMKDELKNILLNHNTPLHYRFYRVKNKWYLQILITHTIDSYDTRKKYGVIGLDFNSGFISLSETNESGNLVSLKHYNLNYHGGGNKALNEMLNVICEIVKYAKSRGKDISIEDLSFSKTKSRLLKGNKNCQYNYNHMIHTLDYARYTFRLENKCHKEKVYIGKVNPRYTSQIGSKKYSYKKKLSVHQAASYVIARRHQGYND